MPLSVDEFAQRLAASGITAVAEVRQFLDDLTPTQRPADGQAFARLLVNRGLLTPFQANHIHQGQGTDLVLDEYVLLDKLGQGGMGVVYKAEHRRLKKTVALKVLPGEQMKTPDAVRRFQREAQAAAKLSHPNIVAALDAREVKGRHIFVMEYVEGQDLSRRVKSAGPLPLALALDCIRQAARGLEHAHAHDVIHRDIKPSNLLLTGSRGEGPGASQVVKILDLGLARVNEPLAASEATSAASVTQTGAILGTVDYMSPEQALDTKHADERSDVYSLGCTFHYLVTGRVMYTGDTYLNRILAHRELPLPSLGGPPIPAQVEKLFHKMVAKRPGDRFQSMTEVVLAVEQCQALVADCHAATATFPATPAATPGDVTLQVEPNRRAASIPESTMVGGSEQARRRFAPWLIVGMALVALAVLFLAPHFRRDGTTAKLGTDLKIEDMSVAIWIMQNLGGLTLVNDNGATWSPQTVTDVENAKEPFHIHGISFQDKRTSLRDEDLAPWVKLRKLQQIQLGEVGITDQGLVHVGQVKGLTSISLARLPVTGSGMSALNKLDRLVTLNLGLPQVRGPHLAWLRDLPKLQNLTLRNMEWKEADLKVLSELTQLKILSLEGNPIKGLYPVAKLNLETLILDRTAIEDWSIVPLNKLKLTALSLNDTAITDKNLIQLSFISTLKHLDLRKTQVTKERVEFLQQTLPGCKIVMD